MPRLSLSLLGGFQAAVKGEPITGFRSAKVRALLAYLAVEADRPHPRETLAGLLWPDHPEPSARRNLRRALAALRQVIGDAGASPPHLLVTRDSIQFNAASDHWLDERAFETLLETGLRGRSGVDQLEEAARLYRGAFLEGFSLRDSAAYEGWTVLTREHLQRQAVAALDRLAQEYERRGEPEQACDFARRQLELEPWREEGHRRLMRVLALCGQRGAALAQYEACHRALAVELEVEPEDETTALYERIRDGTLTSTEPVQVGAGEEDMRRGAPSLPAPLTRLIGREGALKEIKQLLGDPTCRLLTLVGPGGIGKTHLALETASELAPTGVPVPEGQSDLFVDGVRFVLLAAAQDAEAIVPGVAQRLGIRPAVAQGMGFINKESGSVAGAELCHGAQVGTGALHAEQTFRDHQRLVPWVPIPAALQLVVEIDEVVVGKALKPRTTGLHSCE